MSLIDYDPVDWKFFFLSRVLLVDVRNATELEDPGQIPGSVNLPLFEIPEAFLLDDNEFLEKYGFNKPGIEAKNVVLTCR